MLNMPLDAQVTQEFIAISELPLRLSVRVNPLKMSIADFQALALSQGWSLQAIPWCETGFWLRLNDQDQGKLGNLLEHILGCFYIQEASSMLPVEALFHQLNSIDINTCILDAAAAPGSKSTQLAARMNNQGLLVANEYSASRLKGLYANVLRCGISNTALSHHNADVFGSWLPDSFDAVLLDAPCSGEGTYRKDRKAFNNWSLESVNSIAQLQESLINSAYQALKPGGVLVYSTCTLNPIENQQVVQSLLNDYPHQLEAIELTELFEGAHQCRSDNGSLLVMPQVFDSEGFYIAALRKSPNAPLQTPKQRKARDSGFKPVSSKQAETIRNYFENQFGYHFNASPNLYNRDNEFWLFAKPMQTLETKLRFSRLGLKLADQHKKVVRATHEVAMALGNDFKHNCIELSRSQCIEYLQGKDLHGVDGLEELSSGDILIRYQGLSVGLAKNLQTRLKNALPRDLVKDAKIY
ncbi:16S rRNA (cytosine(1407)-C(5))-methyltransferase RsmF [Alginatibacterium sediminis]|uniref:16S rRNA (Cytosine(1407)-C(5))-methyltransferase RsmF n=2 Tax=Alginatibacterium sediminis TaxID=2164068 RepID=A0A420EIJ4_9ALTE|nr:16S rRNA (cytosine(1407)-C(5))-methyltransferase RsmF [Alginatibacterium sediminis]